MEDHDITKLASKACYTAYQENIEFGLPVLVAKGDTLVEVQKQSDGTMTESVVKSLPPLTTPKQKTITIL